MKPVPFFPALMSEPAAAIVPEGTRRVSGTWRDQCVGTGPFRVVSFEPGRRLQLEKNPHYWREGYPRSNGIIFRFGMSPEEIRSEFLEGRLSIASDLLPADVEALRRDPRHGSGYRESPRLSIYCVAFNVQDEWVTLDGPNGPALVGRLPLPHCRILSRRARTRCSRPLRPPRSNG